MNRGSYDEIITAIYDELTDVIIADMSCSAESVAETVFERLGNEINKNQSFWILDPDTQDLMRYYFDEECLPKIREAFFEVFNRAVEHFADLHFANGSYFNTDDERDFYNNPKEYQPYDFYEYPPEPLELPEEEEEEDSSEFESPQESE